MKNRSVFFLIAIAVSAIVLGCGGTQSQSAEKPSPVSPSQGSQDKDVAKKQPPISSVMLNQIFSWPAEYSGDAGKPAVNLTLKTSQNDAEIKVVTYRGGNNCTLKINYNDLKKVAGGYEGTANGSHDNTKEKVSVKLRFEKKDDGSFAVYQLSGNPTFLKENTNLIVQKVSVPNRSAGTSKPTVIENNNDLANFLSALYSLPKDIKYFEPVVTSVLPNTFAQFPGSNQIGNVEIAWTGYPAYWRDRNDISTNPLRMPTPLNSNFIKEYKIEIVSINIRNLSSGTSLAKPIFDAVYRKLEARPSDLMWGPDGSSVFAGWDNRRTMLTVNKDSISFLWNGKR